MLDVMLSSTKKISGFLIRRISSMISSIGRRVCVFPKYDWIAQNSHRKWQPRPASTNPTGRYRFPAKIERSGRKPERGGRPPCRYTRRRRPLRKSDRTSGQSRSASPITIDSAYSLVIGEAERLWPEVLYDFRNGR